MNNNKPADLSQQQHADYIQQEWDRLQNEAIAAQRWRLEHEKSQSPEPPAGGLGAGIGFQLAERWSLKVFFYALLFITLGYGLLMWGWL